MGVREYIAAFKANPETDAIQYGVKGMRWGVRRSRSQLRAARGRGDSSAKKESTDAKPQSSSKGSVAKRPAGNIQDRVESSPERYARLQAEAKAGRADQMTEADLKFFNARTEALTKIKKVTEEQPSWLRETATKVVQQSAQRQMQGLADTLADKYIGEPLKSAVTKKASESVEEAIQRGASERIRKETIEKGIEAIVKKRAS